MEVRLVKREDIDKAKWDSCVHYANTGNMFAYTWYLDNVAREWDGLVEGDYVSVFPLIKKELKSNVAALHIPELLPKAGIYSVHLDSIGRINAFMEKIPEVYQVREFSFSKRMTLVNREGLEIAEDYEINLRGTYEEVYKKYSQELVDGLNEINKTKSVIDSAVKPEEIAELYIGNTKGATDEKKHAYLRIMYNLLHRGTGFISGVRNEKGELIAADYFGYSHGKIVSLMPTHKNNDLGKFALWKLTDLMFQTHSGKPSIFDFNTKMGDINPIIFGAKKVEYSIIRENKLKGLKKWWVSI